MTSSFSRKLTHLPFFSNGRFIDQFAVQNSFLCQKRKKFRTEKVTRRSIALEPMQQPLLVVDHQIIWAYQSNRVAITHSGIFRQKANPLLVDICFRPSLCRLHVLPGVWPFLENDDQTGQKMPKVQQSPIIGRSSIDVQKKRCFRHTYKHKKNIFFFSYGMVCCTSNLKRRNRRRRWCSKREKINWINETQRQKAKDTIKRDTSGILWQSTFPPSSSQRQSFAALSSSFSAAASAFRLL